MFNGLEIKTSFTTHKAHGSALQIKALRLLTAPSVSQGQEAGSRPGVSSLAPAITARQEQHCCASRPPAPTLAHGAPTVHAKSLFSFKKESVESTWIKTPAHTRGHFLLAHQERLCLPSCADLSFFYLPEDVALSRRARDPLLGSHCRSEGETSHLSGQSSPKQQHEPEIDL